MLRLAPILLLPALLFSTAWVHAQESVTDITVPLLVSHSDPEVTGEGLGFDGVPQNQIGTREGARDEQGQEDKIDFFGLIPARFVDLTIRHAPTEVGWRYSFWRHDFRAPLTPQESQTWTILVVTDTFGDVTISWGDLSDIPSYIDLTFNDPSDLNADGIISYSMRGRQSFTYPSDRNSKLFNIVMTNTLAPSTAFTAAPTVTNITSTSASVGFATNVPTTVVIDYGPTVEYGEQATVTTPADTHTVALTGLTPGTTYHYRVTVTHPEGGDAATEDLTFSTLPGLTLENVEIIANTGTSVTLQVTTSVPSTLVVDYGPTEEYGLQQAATEPNTTHSVTLGDLTPGTTYHYRVTASASGQDPVSTEDETFVALEPVAFEDFEVVAITRGSAVVTLTTDVPATAVVNYGTSADALTGEVVVEEPTTSLSVPITGLEPETDYLVRVRLQAPNRSEAVTPLLPFRTLTSAAKGDIDGNAVINITDIILAIRFSLGLQDPTPEQLGAADVDDNGVVNVQDIIRIVRISLGLDTQPG